MKVRDHTRSNSHMHTLSGKVKDRIRRFLPLALSVCVMVGGMPSIPIMAEAADEEDYVQEFNLSAIAIDTALTEALTKGETVNPSDYVFSGAEQEVYEELFYDTADVYELYPEFESDEEGKLRLRVFARLDCDRELESTDILNEDQIIFLLLNHTDEEILARIYIDEYETGLIRVVPKSDVSLLESIEAIEEPGTLEAPEPAISTNAPVSAGESASTVAEIQDQLEKPETEIEDDYEITEISDESAVDESDKDKVSEDNREESSDDSIDNTAENIHKSDEKDISGSVNGDSEKENQKDNNVSKRGNDKNRSDKDDALTDPHRSDNENSTDKSDKDISSADENRSEKRSSTNTSSDDSDKTDKDEENKKAGRSGRSIPTASISTHKMSLLSAEKQMLSEDEAEEPEPEIVIETAEVNTDPDDIKEDSKEDSNVIVEFEATAANNAVANIMVAPASTSDWSLASASDADHSLLNGELLDPVIVNSNRAAVAFVGQLNEVIAEKAEEQLYTYEDESIAVSVLLPEGTTVPKSAILDATPVTEEDTGYNYDDLLMQAEAVIKDGQVSNILFYDIGFYSSDEEYIPVEDTAQVVLKFKDSILSCDNSIHILHYANENEEPVDINGLYKTGDDGGSLTEVNFETDGFSIFGIADVVPLAEGVSDFKIDEAIIDLEYSGTAPFDKDDNDGNDSSAENDIIRSFDEAGYSMTIDIERNDGAADATSVRIHFEVSVQGSTIENYFDTGVFTWATRYSVTENTTSRTIEGYRDYKDDGGISNADISGLTMAVQVLAMSDGMILQPRGKVWLEELDADGNGTNILSDTVDLDFPALEISAALQLNVYLYQGNTTQTSVEGTFNFATGGEDYINYDKGTSIDGRMYGYGIALEMYTSNEDQRQMRGQALPDGSNIELSVNLNSTYKVNSNSINLGEYKDGNYQLLFYALEGNTNSNSTCADGRSLISTDGDHPSEYYSNHIPLNKPTNTTTQSGVTAVEDGGNWKALSQDIKTDGTTVTIQVDSYKIEQLLFPYAYPNNSNATDGFYTNGLKVQEIDKAAVFSGGELWVIQPYSYVDKEGITHSLKDEAGDGTFTIQVKDGVVDGTAGTFVSGSYNSYAVIRDSDGKIEVTRDSEGNIIYGNKTTINVDTQVYKSDDSRSQDAAISVAASFSNKIKYISTAKKNAYTNVQQVLGDTSGTSYAPIGYDDVSIAGGLQYTPNTKRNISAALNAMVKFDASALSIKDSGWLSFLRYDGLSNNSSNYSIFFGYLPSGGNWESETVMQKADEDDLIWYSERQSDKLCVAVLFEYRRPGTTTGDTRLRPGMAMNVLSDTSLSGNVYIACEVTRLWTVENVATLYNEANGTSITYNDVLNDTTGGQYITSVIPSAAGDYYGSHGTDALPKQDYGYGSGGDTYNTPSKGTTYTKSVYGEDGKVSGHNGSDGYGDSLLILGYTTNIDINIAQKAEDQQTGNIVDKSIFNFDNAERIADLVVTGGMTLQQATDIDWGKTTATITVTLPDGATYRQGSAQYGIADSNGDFTITYTQSGTLGQEGTVSDGSPFEQTTNEAEYEAWLADGSATGGMLYISTDASGNTVLTFSVKGVPIQNTDVVKIYFSVDLGDESSQRNDLVANDSLIFDAYIRTTEDHNRKISEDNGNESEVTIVIARTGSNTFSKYIVSALNEVSDDISWVITWDNSSGQGTTMMEILDDMPDNSEKMGSYRSDYSGSYEIVGFAIDLSYITAKDAQEYLNVYATTNAAYEGETLIPDDSEGTGSSSGEISWEDIVEEANKEDGEWKELSIDNEGKVDFSGMYDYECADDGKTVTGVKNLIYTWAIGGNVPNGESVHITLTIHQYGAQGGDLMTNVAYDSTGTTIFHRSATAYRVLRTISGTVWLDEDIDGGIRTGVYKNEQLLSDVDVALEIQNTDNSWSAAEDLYGNKCAEKTDKNGDYEFTNLKSGTYRVVLSGTGTSEGDSSNSSALKSYPLSDHVLTVKEAPDILEAYNSKAVQAEGSGYTVSDPQGVISSEDLKLPSKENMTVYDYIYEVPYQNAGYTKKTSFTTNKIWEDLNDNDITSSRENGRVKVEVEVSGSGSGDDEDVIESREFDLNHDNDWTETLDNLIYYDGHGKPLDYTSSICTVEETEGNDGYTVTIGKITEIIPDNDDGDTQVIGYSVNVTNKAGYELPKTGGSGTLPFRLAGLMLMGGATMLYMNFRRRRAKPGG